MNAKEVQELFCDYLNNLNLNYNKIFENEECFMLVPDSLEGLENCIHIQQDVKKVIGKSIEMCIRFGENSFSITSFYSQIFSKSDKMYELLEIINYINLNYPANCIVDSKVIFNEKGKDIANITVIPYIILDLMFEEVMNLVINYQQKYLEEICIPLVLSVSGKTKQAKEYINKLSDMEVLI